MKKETGSEKRQRRHKRVRAKIFGTKERPRLCVFRSAKHIYAQLIDDQKGQTLLETSDLTLSKLTDKQLKGKKKKPSIAKTPESKNKKRLAKIAKAYQVGKTIANKALQKKIKKVVFDRGGYQYHGRVKALAEGAREGGLEF